MDFPLALFLFAIAVAILYRIEGRGILTVLRHYISSYLSLNLKIPPAEEKDGTAKLWMRFTVTVVVLAAAIYVILSEDYDDEGKKWAYGTIGIILGYWLGHKD